MRKHPIRRLNTIRFTDLVYLMLLTTLCCNAQVLQVYSITHSRQTSGDNGYTLDGTRMVSARSKLLNPSYFSPGGWYRKSIAIHDTFAVSGSLRGASAMGRNAILFFGSFDVLNAHTVPFTRAEKDSLYEWSKRGGKVIIAGHGLQYMGAELNLMDSLYGFEMTSTSMGEELIADPNAPHPGPFKGYFENIDVVKQWGAAQGFYNKIPPRAVVYARDQAGRPTMFMDCNTLDLIVADVDVFSDLNADITQGPELWSKSDRLWGNTIVFMDSIPDPPFLKSTDGKLLTVEQEFTAYQWYRDSVAIPHANTSTVDATQSGSYFVEVPVFGGCLARSAVHITPKTGDPVQDTVKASECSVFVPSAFSPNGNGLNETACVYGPCISSVFFRIFDRWGQLVFSSNELEQCWNGLIGGRKAASAGTYAWTLEASMSNGEKISRMGHITLLR